MLLSRVAHLCFFFFFVVQITCQGKDGRIERAITDYRQGIFSADWFACFLCAYVHRCFCHSLADVIVAHCLHFSNAKHWNKGAAFMTHFKIQYTAGAQNASCKIASQTVRILTEP